MKQPRSVSLTNNRLAFLAFAVMAIGLFRVFLTYDMFWQTWDEPAHIAAGMEWLDKGQYQYELFHPPLSRVMTAVGLYFDGIRSAGKTSMFEEGQTILFANHSYERNLVLARIGILPFFVLASLIVTLWAKTYDGAVTGLLSVLLFTTLPSVLAHSGLATMDMAAAATGVFALFALDLWFNGPTWFRSGLLGSAAGLAVLAKFTAGGFIVVCACLMGIVYGLKYRRTISPKTSATIEKKMWIKGCAFAAMVSFLVIWGGYRFSVHWVNPSIRPHSLVDRIVGSNGPLHEIAYSLVENTPIPAPEFVTGIIQFIKRNKDGHLGYLLGEISTQGWWYYFPLVLSIKIPLGFLALSAFAMFFIFKGMLTGDHDRRLLVPLVSIMGILGLSTQSHVNNSERHVLIIYPLLAVLAGYGASQLFGLQGRLKTIGKVLATVFLLWHLASSFNAHPDYLAYFNEIAGNRPEEIVIDANLDWGQDLKRLAKRLQNRGVSELWIRYNGSAPVNNTEFGLPSVQELPPYQQVTGWIAISVINQRRGTGEPPYDQYSWLDKHQPIERIGKSIFLYNIPR